MLSSEESPNSKNDNKDNFQTINKLIQSKRRLPYVYDKLTWDESLQCFNFLTDIEPEKLTQSVWRDAFMSFMICSDPDFGFKFVLVNEKVHRILEHILPQCEFSPIITLFKTVFNQFLGAPKKYGASLLTFCEFLNDKHLLLNISMYYLETLLIDDPHLTECLNFLGLYLRCILSLKGSFPERLSTLIAKLYLEMIRSRFALVISQLLLQSENSEVRHSTIQQIVTQKIEISNFLADIKLKDCKYLEEQFVVTVEESVNGDEDLKHKLDNINKLAIDPVELNLLQVIDVIVFLKEPDLSFKRVFIEHLLFGGSPFPFYKTVSRISNEINNFFIKHQSELKSKPYLISFIMNKESFLNSIMRVQLRIWIESGAKTVKDMESIFELIPVLLEKLDLLLTDVYYSLPLEDLIRIVSNFIKSIDYKKARNFQLNKMRTEELDKWKAQMATFDSILLSQVHDFVRNQRLVRFQKGIWVYSQNPSDLSISCPKLYFTILSDNQANLLVREFESKTDEFPLVEGSRIVYKNPTPTQSLLLSTTIVIPLKSIAFFESRDVSTRSAASSSTQLIDLAQNKGYTKVKLLDMDKKRLLKVYLDTKEAKFIWLDGLKLISPHELNDSLSMETKEQLVDLISLRKDVQMVNLHTMEQLDPTVGLDENDDEYYDLDTLISLPKHFHYE